MEKLVIGGRFCGPVGSANGGYACGLVAKSLAEDAIVRLHKPPPLDAELTLIQMQDTVELRDGDRLIATGRQAHLSLEIPSPPNWQEALAATERYSGFSTHPYPDCFVCGPDRLPGDGLRIFAGQVANRDIIAAPWIPDPGLKGEDGKIASEYVWAALDCPGAFVLSPQDGKPILLGELTVHIEDLPRAGSHCQVIAWLIEALERKYITGTALIGEDGSTLAFGKATWIILNRLKSE